MITKEEFEKFKSLLIKITSPNLSAGDPLFGDTQEPLMILVKNKSTNKILGITATQGWTNTVYLSLEKSPKSVLGVDADPAKEYESEGLTIDDVVNAMTDTFNEGRLARVGNDLFMESVNNIIKSFYPKMYRGLLQLNIVRNEPVKSIYVHENKQLGRLELVYSPSMLATAAIVEFGANLLKSSDMSRVTYDAFINFVQTMCAFVIMHELSHLIYRHIHDDMPDVSTAYDKSGYENYLADQYINNRLVMVLNNNPKLKQSMSSMGIPEMTINYGLQDKITSESTINPELIDISSQDDVQRVASDAGVSIYLRNPPAMWDFLKGAKEGDRLVITMQNRNFGSSYSNFSDPARDIFKFLTDLNSFMKTNDRAETINDKVENNQIEQQVNQSVQNSNMSDDDKKKVSDAIKKQLDAIKKAAQAQANSQGQQGQSGQSGQSGSQSNQQGQSGQSGQSGQGGQSGQSGQSNQGNQSNQQGQSGNGGQSGQQSGQSSQQSQSGQGGQSGQSGAGAPSNSLAPNRQSRLNNPGQQGQSQGQSGSSGQGGQGGQSSTPGTGSSQGPTGYSSSQGQSSSSQGNRQGSSSIPQVGGNSQSGNSSLTQDALSKAVDSITGLNKDNPELSKVLNQIADKINKKATADKIKQKEIATDTDTNNNVKKTSLTDLKKTPDSFDKSLSEAAKELANEESKASSELRRNPNSKVKTRLGTDPAVTALIKSAESSTGKVAKGWRQTLKRMIEDSTGIRVEYNPSAPNARIQGQFGREELKTELGSLVLSFDVSSSMSVSDFKAALTYVADMMKMRLNFDKVGFIYWGSDSEGFKPKSIPPNKLYKKALELNKGDRRGTDFDAAFEQFTTGNLKGVRPDLVIVFTDGEVYANTKSKEFAWYKRNKRKILYVLKPNSSYGLKTILKYDPSAKRRIVMMTDNHKK